MQCDLIVSLREIADVLETERKLVSGVVDALKFYLNAGDKESRRKASVKAKEALNALEGR